jgi:thioredoxin-related protein
MKPIVDGLEREYEGRLLVIRLDIQSEVGRELAPVYDFQYTPTFIFFDSAGTELWREVGGLDTERLRQSLLP